MIVEYGKSDIWHNSTMTAVNPDNKAEPADSKPDRIRKDDTASGAPNKDLRREIGGRDGPDPTRYGDWEKNGRCIDF